MNIDQLITTYGPEIAKQLQIASAQVYGTLLWYLKVNAILGLSVNTLTLICSVIPLFWIIPFVKNHLAGWMRETDGLIMIVFIFLAAMYAGLIFILQSILYSFGDLVTQIVVPQYWLIDQIVQKATGK